MWAICLLYIAVTLFFIIPDPTTSKNSFVLITEIDRRISIALYEKASFHLATMNENLVPRSAQCESEHRKAKESLVIKIKEYLDRVGNVGDPVALQILQESKIVLEAQNQLDKKSHDTTHVVSALNDIKSTLQRVESRKEISTARNYAAVAAAGHLNEGGSVPVRSTLNNVKTQKAKEQTPSMIKRARELTIRVTKSEDRERIKQTSTKDLVEALQKRNAGIIGVSRLNSGDIRIHTETAAIKKSLYDNTGWVREVAASAAVQRRTFAIQVRGVRMQHIDVTNQTRAIEYLHAVNARLHAGLKIVKVAWSNKAIREGKVHSTLHMEVETAPMANRLINEGLLVDYEIKHCERFHKNNILVQCFNCYKYGHISKWCKHPTACGRCAGGHPTHECNPETTGAHPMCATCEKPGHPAWSPVCVVRTKEKKKVNDARKRKAHLYEAEGLAVAPAFNFGASNPPSRGRDYNGRPRLTDGRLTYHMESY